MPSKETMFHVRVTDRVLDVGIILEPYAFYGGLLVRFGNVLKNQIQKKKIAIFSNEHVI